MRNILHLSISFILFFLFLGVSEGKTIDRFYPSESGVCRELIGSAEIIQIFGNKECIFGVDINSFSKFGKGRLLFGEIGKNTYSDNKNLYYSFTNDFRWKKIEMNIKKIRKLKNGYLSDGVSYFYYNKGYPYPYIISFGKINEGTLNYLDQDIVKLNNKFYSKGELLEGYSNENIKTQGEFVFVELENKPGLYKVLLKDDLGGKMLQEIEGVDKDTFKRSSKEKTNGYYSYEDKRNYYTSILGPYNYYYMAVPK